MKTKHWIGIGVAIGVIGMLAVIWVKWVRQQEGAPLSEPCPIPVQVCPVTTGTVDQVRHVLGTAYGMEEIEIIPQVMAQIVSIPVREGQYVHKGELLVKLDDRDFASAIAQAEAAVIAARSAYETQKAATERDRKLFEVKAISQEQWEWSQEREATAKARLEIARKQLELAKTRLSYCWLVAPSDGVITARLADPGDLAMPGKPILKMATSRRIRVRAALPSEDDLFLRPGTPVILQAMGTKLQSRVTRVFPATSTNHLIQIECDLDSPPTGWVPGLRLDVDVILRSASGLRVPNTALLEGSQGDWVFVIQNSRVHPRKVKVVLQGSECSIVEGELQIGDLVVVGQPLMLMTLSEGAAVTVLQTNNPLGR